ncbi:UNVERIFIED_CONTAM: putative membrane protein [Pseudacidovorax intermedius]|nr:putative membrane protein [Pseudacidovorax intermedius]
MLIIIYGLRPSRFSKIIVKSYKEGGTEKFSKKSFFWIVYIGVLLAVFGIPLLIFKNALGNIAEVITTANQYIIENTGLLTMALIFLGLNMLGFYYDFINAFHYAKIQFFRLLLAFMLTLPISAFLYLISVVLKMKADVLIIICLAFNLSFLYLALMALRKQGSQKNNASALKF